MEMMQKTRRHVDRLMTSPRVLVVIVKNAQKQALYTLSGKKEYGFFNISLSHLNLFS